MLGLGRPRSSEYRSARAVQTSRSSSAICESSAPPRSSARTSKPLVANERAEVLVLMLGDQPGVTAATVAALLAGRGGASLAACGYADGRGHPLAFDRSVFSELASLHGDKGVWKLLERHAAEVVDVPVEGPIPLDVDTWEDYEAVLALHELSASVADPATGRRT
jgi:CTP:molybdopterin cytidylyltransferase MocA